MADQTNTGLPSASALTGAESFYTVQGGNSREGLISQLLDYILGNQLLVPSDLTGTSYTIQDTDKYVCYRLTNAAGCTVVLPLNATEAVSIGARIRLIVIGAGGLVVDVESGSVTIISEGDANLADQNAIVELHKTGTNEWALLGNFHV